MLITQDMRETCLLIDKKEIKKIKAEGFVGFNHRLIAQKIWMFRVCLNALAQVSKSFISDLGQAFQGTAVINLNLDESDIDENNVQYVIELLQALQNTPITKLYLDSNRIAGHAPALIRALRGTQINCVDLSNNNISDNYMLELGEALAGTQITTLYLNNNQINKHAHLLAQALKNTCVTTLSLSNDTHRPDEVEFANSNQLGKKALLFAQALWGSPVTHLHLRGNHIREYAPLFARALQGTKVTWLDLSDNEIREYTPLFVEALQGTQVTTLDLSYNNIGEYLSLLAPALQTTRITTLNLTENELGKYPSAVQAFIQDLPKTQLITLDLTANEMKKYAVALAQNLQNACITSLNLTDNSLTDKKMLKIVKALSTAPVHTLILNENQLSGAPKEQTNHTALDSDEKISWIAALRETKVHTLGLANNYLKNLDAIAQDLIYTSVKCINVAKSYLILKQHDQTFQVFGEKSKPEQILIHQVTLANCRRDYIHQLGLAEHHAYLLKKLYKEVFPSNTQLFPPSIGYLIAKFLGYTQDQNLLKRFLNALKSSVNNSLTTELATLTTQDISDHSKEPVPIP